MKHLIQHLPFFTLFFCLQSKDFLPTITCKATDNQILHVSLSYNNQPSLMRMGTRLNYSPYYRYNPLPNLFSYSSQELKNFFIGKDNTEEEILSYERLYTSDEFIKLIKTFDAYETHIISLYNKYNNMWFINKIPYLKFIKRIQTLYDALLNRIGD